jgi:nucleoside phosphorylase
MDAKRTGSVRLILRRAAAVALIATASSARPALADERVLILSAYSPEQAVLLQAAGVDGPEDQIGVFNGRRFFAGRIAGHDVVLGLTGIGLVDAENTTTAALGYFRDHGIIPKGIVFSGVAGGPNIGDVVIPNLWSDAEATYSVNSCMYAVAEDLTDLVLNPYVPVEDAACTGRDPALPPTLVRVETDPQVIVGGLGHSADPFNGRAVPCVSPPGPALLGCEACGAPVNTSPDPGGTVGGTVPFLDPQFYLDLLEYFADPAPPSGDPVVVDMETAAVAKLAEDNGIPFIAFRAVSDGGGDPIFASALIGFPVQFFIYQQLAADNAAAVVIEFLEQWNPAPPLAVSPAQAVVRAGRTLQFSAVVSCLASSDVVWSVQEPNGGTIDANGLYTAPLVLNASRTAHVVATHAVNGQIQAVATVSLRQNAGSY